MGIDMEAKDLKRHCLLSIVVPCYNEEKTLQACIERVIQIGDDRLDLDLIIVDDGSFDRSPSIANSLAEKYPEVRVITHEKNRGKGAALRSGFSEARGEFVAVQDADLEYDPMELRKLLIPLIEGKADVVFGSRYLTGNPRRILYFWHSLMNRCLTLVSNIFTDLDLSDMETGYKVFSRTLIQSIDIEENRFGIEPEIVAKVAQERVRVYEIGISYDPRTYTEGKKITWKDGIRALYCIFHYGAPKAPIPVQFCIYLAIGGISAVFNVLLFLIVLAASKTILVSAVFAYVAAATLNYYLCIWILFRHKARWNSYGEIAIYFLVVLISGFIDVNTTHLLTKAALSPVLSKSIACFLSFLVNFLGRKYMVFPEPSPGPWKSL